MANQPQVIYLKDYTAPNFTVESIQLDIRVFDQHTIVTSCLTLQRQAGGDLVLFGQDLHLKSIRINDEQYILDDSTKSTAAYQLDDEKLVIFNLADQAVITTEVWIHPENNTQLEGLYKAGKDLFVTQNEPEGFRKITFYPDRPDVLSVFTTRIEADKKYPTLLANGNLLEKGELENGRHFAIWHDPTKKPSYLFACVIGDLAVLKDQYQTAEGRLVNLEIYAVEKDIAKCHIAMQALKHSMQWDEMHYGRSYDLDNYMIVATSQFNMGAMENKGLNIFNTSCVLADEKYTTDMAIMRVQSVIAHEYFHNWTGNRITCRDWFQLCLKEGLTVFRDQSFSEDLQSPAVQRIDDVAVLKSHQFPEDAGPLAHPPRPDHFVEINNFYTATVYEKGAEISRMMATLLGKEKFRQGTDRYFELFDGQAVTVEDWIFALSDGSGVDLSAFLTWYNQPHTPTLSVEEVYSSDEKTYTLKFKQQIKPHHKYPNLKPVPIPIAFALFHPQTGEQLELNHSALFENHTRDGMYLLTQAQDEICLPNIEHKPVVSLLRNFSAPVNLDFNYSDRDLAFLLQYENNGFNQWQATQTLLERILLSELNITENPAVDIYLAAMKSILPKISHQDPLLTSRLLDIPSESYLASKIDHDYCPQIIHDRREKLIMRLVEAMQDFWLNTYHHLNVQTHDHFSRAMGIRALRNICLDMLNRQQDKSAIALALAQYQQAQTMTEKLGAIRVLVWSDSQYAKDVLADFYAEFKDEDLAIDQWFMVQSAHPNITAAQLHNLTTHADYDLNTPNRIRSITSGLIARPVNLWNKHIGIAHFIQLAKIMDDKNPIVGARLIQALSRWYTLQTEQQQQIKLALQDLQQQVQSKNVLETINSMLDI